MDAYQYALMKETLERIHREVLQWREHDQLGLDFAIDAVYYIETILDEAGLFE